MTQADRIRQFVFDSYIIPARTKGHETVTVRAGDVHREMRLVSAMPAVCSAIGSNKFEELAKVTTVARRGPANGANVYFEFRLGAGLHDSPSPPPQPNFTQHTIHRIGSPFRATLKSPASDDHTSQPTDRTPPAELDLAGALVLLSCVKTKLSHPAAARDLYTSAWFRKTRGIVEASGARWFVLSALYGLVSPEAKIAPYDHTLNNLPVAERREWAKKVMAQLVTEIAEHNRIVMFAGQRYREFLVGPLEERGKTIEVPMAHLAQGEQLAWLSE
jgi:hypothetical protein